MGVKVDGDNKELSAFAKMIDHKMSQAFAYAAEAGLTECKRKHTYTDRTGKLTASMGYVFRSPSSAIVSMGQDSGAGTAEGKSEGKQRGEEYSVTAAQAIGGKAFGVSIFAGAEYAKHVSNKKAVLEPALPILEKTLERLIKAIKNAH